METDEAERKLQDRVQHYKTPSSWQNLEGDELRVALCEGLALCGISNDEGLVRAMAALYRLAMERLPASTRLGCQAELKQFVQSRKISVNALMPFMYVENDSPIVASTAIDLSYYMANEADPLAGVRDLIERAERREIPNVGAVFGGLVALGDARVNKELIQLRDKLDSHEINVAANFGTGFPTVAALEFWLGWLEELVGRGEDERFGSCASAVVLLVRKTQVQEFADLLRNFSCYVSAAAGEAVVIREKIPLSEIGRRFADRLYALEAREAPPKLMSDVLKVYGLEPRAPERERGHAPPPRDATDAPVHVSYTEWQERQYAVSIESALDRIETALKTFGLSPKLDQKGLRLQVSAGSTVISVTRPLHDSRAPMVSRLPGVVVSVHTWLQPELREMLGKMPPELHRFATLGALIQDEDGPVVVSRASLFDQSGERDPAPLLLAAAAIYGADSLCRAAAKAALGDNSPPAGMPQRSEWRPGDFETIKQEIEKSPQITCRLDDESFSIGFPVHGTEVEGPVTEVAALVQIFWNMPHVACGAGLLIGLELMVGTNDRGQLAALIEHLNRSESQPEHGFPHFGAWCPGRFEGSLGYVTFLPNALKSLKVERTFVDTALLRAEVTVSSLARSNLLPPQSSRQ
jgi:hypothetical protein